jgi:hypothetical protein
MELDLEQAMGNRGVMKWGMGGKEEEGLVVVVGMMWFEETNSVKFNE